MQQYRYIDTQPLSLIIAFVAFVFFDIFSVSMSVSSNFLPRPQLDDLQKDIRGSHVAVADVLADARRPTTSILRRPTALMIVQSRIRSST